MFSRLRKRLTYANVAMTLALVFAMSGGAWAAGKFVITSTKQIKPSVLKQLQGKTGKAGANGANGANGAQGTAGANGKDGANGTNGKDGAAGTNGTSVTSAKLSAGSAACKEGGSEFTAAEGKKTTACNGSPWAAGGTLPAGATETGTWGTAGQPVVLFPKTVVLMDAPISFTIPLAAPLTDAPECGEPSKPACVTHVIEPGGALPAGCTGSLEEPGAEKGNLCVFVAEAHNVVGFNVHAYKFLGEPSLGTSKTGALLMLSTATEEQMYASGTWAVTAG
jgi:hypothetical protein